MARPILLRPFDPEDFARALRRLRAVRRLDPPEGALYGHEIPDRGGDAVRRKLIGEFLAELAENPEWLVEYGRDQMGFLRERSGLTEEQQDILGSNDLTRIRDAIRDEYQRAEIIVVPLPTQHVA